MDNETLQKRKVAIITGVGGQDGAYLAELLLKKDYRVIGTTRKNTSTPLKNLRYLNIADQIIVEQCDLTKPSEAVRLIETYHPDEVYNLTGQSSVGLSFKKPATTITSNILPTLNILEAIRTINPRIKFYQASSSDMFGSIERLPATENTRFNPLSPYAVSKVSAHLITKNYRESFEIFAVSGILFNHESFLRENTFFVKKMIKEAVAVSKKEQDVIHVGNINVKRDFGFAPKYAEAMWLMLQQDTPKDMLVCSGQSVSLRDIAEYILNKFNIPKEKLVIDEGLFRISDIPDMYGDNAKTRQELGWEYDIDFFEVLDVIIEEELRSTAS